MERRSFLKQCGVLGSACIGVSLVSCSPTHYIQATGKNNILELKKGDFEIVKNNKSSFRKYVIVKLEGADFPIVVYKNESDYTALLLRCTHQGNELNVSGDLITCSAHGSEFDRKGGIVQGPADQKLKSFPVKVENEKIYISLAG